MFLNYYYNNIIIYTLGILASLVPFLLFTGPAIPDILVSFTGLLFIFYVILNKKFNEYFYNKYSLVFIIFYSVMLLSSILSENIFYSLSSSLFYFRFFVFSICIYFLCKETKFFLKLFFSLLIVIFLLHYINSVYQNYNHIDLFGNHIVRINRVSGLFGLELVLGSFISRLLPLLIALCFLLLFKNSVLKQFLLFNFIFIFLTYLILLSGERSSIFYFVLTFFLINIIFIKHDFRFVISIFIYSIFFIIFVFFNENFYNRILSTTINQFTGVLNHTNVDLNNNDQNFDELVNTNTKKIYLYSYYHEKMIFNSFEIFKKYPIIGSGPKTYRIECKKTKIIDGCGTHPHNFYLQLLSETGILGFGIIFFLYLFTFFYFIKKIFAKNSINNLVSLTVLVSFLINLFPFLPTGQLFNNFLSILIYLPLGFYIYFNNE